MTTSTHTERLIKKVVALCDRGRSPAEIAEATDISLSYTYMILREHRPDRPRKLRGHRSPLRKKIIGFHKAGMKASRIVEMTGVSRAYVHRIISEIAA